MTTRFALFGSAGTGKTSFGIEHAAENIREGMAPDELAYLAFTRAAARVAVRRIRDAVPGAPAEGFHGFRTLHSWCLREMQKASHERLNVMTRANWREFSKQTGMEVSGEDVRVDDLGDQIMGMMAAGSEWDECKNAYSLSRLTSTSLEELTAVREQPSEFAIQKLNYVPDDMYQTFVEKYENYKRKEGLVDFTDMLEWAARHAPMPENIRRVIVDEAQDLSGLLWFVLNRIFQDRAESILIIGDDWQCLPKGSLVKTPNGDVAIEELEPGDEVLSSWGVRDGVKRSRVVNTGSRSVDENIYRIKTKSGAELLCTGNHLIPACWPRSKKPGWHYVYLMKKPEVGWRIGVTDDPACRLRFDGAGVEGLLPIVALRDRLEARVLENILSYRHGIPQLLFDPAQTSREEMPLFALETVFGSLNTDAAANHLLLDRGKEWKGFLRPQGTVRGRSDRRYVYIDALDRSRNTKRLFQVRYESIGARTRKSFVTLVQAREAAAKISAEYGAPIVERYCIVPRHRMEKIPARNILPGMMLARVGATGTVLDQVERVETEAYKGRVYDIEVEMTHNFVLGSGLVVGNSIYAFAGVKAEQFLAESKKGKRAIQTLTYRFDQRIVDFAAEIIDRVEVKQEREVKSAVTGINHLIRKTGSFEPDPREGLILHRHVAGCRAIGDRYMEAGMPFRNERGRDPLGAEQRVEAYKAMRRLQEGAVVPLTEVQLIFTHLMKSNYVDSNKVKHKLVVHGGKKKVMGKAGETNLKKLLDDNILTDTGHKVLKERNYEMLQHEKDLHYYDRLLGNGFSLEDRGPSITTIHGSKGRQAPRVTVFTEMSTSCWSDTDTEHRLAYVAATRTQKDLEICEAKMMDWGRTQYYYPVNGEGS